eukprot:jgi/Bigna1/140341/aug1.55_g15049
MFRDRNAMSKSSKYFLPGAFAAFPVPLPFKGGNADESDGNPCHKKEIRLLWKRASKEGPTLVGRIGSNCKITTKRLSCRNKESDSFLLPKFEARDSRGARKAGVARRKETDSA